MFQKIARFFIENSKLTLILFISILLSGFGSYLLIPKQYNPTIIVPAFNVYLEANGLDSKQIYNTIISPLENKIMELEGIDEVYGISGDNYGFVMLKFNVGVDKEKAKIRLNQKINENLDLKPLGVGKPIITTIDPDELSQIIIGISYNQEGENILNKEEQYIYLRQISNLIKNELRTIKNTTSLEIVGGLKKNIIINLDLEKLNAKNISVLEVYNSIKSNNSSQSLGNLYLENGEKILINSDGKNDKLDELKKIIVYNNQGSILYLDDIAIIKYGVNRIINSSILTDINGTYNSVFLGVGKSIGSNGVFVTNEVLNKINEYKKTLPGNIKLTIISNEGLKAKDATNMLTMNLFQSIFIVFIVLAFYLGIKNALNTAISIPLTLGSIFLLSLLIGENINRITLFALILVLGMLVDDSTVVVENINRHLIERVKTGKSKLDAILLAIKEVEVGVILSTITRLLAFGAMFAVGGMMGEYMGPIPKFAIMASIISTIVALTINPWISFNLTKNIDQDKLKIKKNKESKLKIRRKYLYIMKIFIGDGKKYKKRRKYFRLFFWISLLLIIIIPIYLGIFKARMLPKSNQDQLYIWIDAPSSWSIEKTNNINKYLDYLLFDENSIIDKNLRNHIKYSSSTIGQAYIGEFANLFRGGSNRIGENQISTRINLYSIDEFKQLYKENRLNSEQFTIKLRKELINQILSKFPDVKISLLEEPPGPPVRSTFLLMIKANATNRELKDFSLKVKNEIEQISKLKNIVDINDSLSTTYRKVNLKFDHESISRAGLTIEQIEKTLAILLNGIDINLINNDVELESSNIILTSNNKQTIDINFLSNISIKNNFGERVFLSSISEFDYNFVGDTIYSDNREKAIYLQAEMGDNSLIYPVLNLIGKFKSNDFLNNEYKIKSFSPYKIEYIGLKDDKSYIIEWSGEWKLTLDTFRDLGIAMFISLISIYLLLVVLFSSFSVAGLIMITFLLGFFGIFPGFSILYLLKGEYFSATSMIGVIALAGIVVGNAIILIDYLKILKNNGLTLKDAILKAGYVRFTPILLTSITTVLGAITIIGDPVWSGLAWAIITGLSVSSILTLIVIPIFYFDSQEKYWK